MSMDRCAKCCAYVDTDDDPDCYEPDPRMSLKGYPDICICEACRERAALEAERAAAADAPDTWAAEDYAARFDSKCR